MSFVEPGTRFLKIRTKNHALGTDYQKLSNSYGLLLRNLIFSDNEMSCLNEQFKKKIHKTKSTHFKQF